ncbi:hypothetical protein AMAG_01479 [Allomyces macrogynus ATCC 38327]|uniref:Uncharacterized protein n=1 Tax=Allomyces macrogynus (strain ATCC 38327) TaxID=578462 RepID=A0A0L0RZ31_ALLM3|nr:hypothetical protein AMAG_01479 [Allomyces macrogynus ATCC 38327]|eukprot:KNE55588.1 hypothetical protein AMAG_01479 [Allomyces macrogynus ATCC 38327]
MSRGPTAFIILDDSSPEPELPPSPPSRASVPARVLPPCPPPAWVPSPSPLSVWIPSPSPPRAAPARPPPPFPHYDLDGDDNNDDDDDDDDDDDIVIVSSSEPVVARPSSPARRPPPNPRPLPPASPARHVSRASTYSFDQAHEIDDDHWAAALIPPRSAVSISPSPRAPVPARASAPAAPPRRSTDLDDLPELDYDAVTARRSGSRMSRPGAPPLAALIRGSASPPPRVTAATATAARLSQSNEFTALLPPARAAPLQRTGSTGIKRRLDDAEREEREREKAAEKRRKEEEKERKRQEREQAQLDKEREKERKRQEREQVKLAKEQEKELRKSFRDANKERTKQDYAQELRAYYHPDLVSPPLNAAGIINAIRDCGAQPVESATIAPTHSIVWERTRKHEYDEDLEMWVPLPHAITVDEPLLVMVWDGKSLGDIVQRDPNFVPNLLRPHMAKRKCAVIVEDIEAWVKKERAREQREFRANMRNGPAGGVEPGARTAAGQWQEVLNAIEDWRLVHHILLFTTKNPGETIALMSTLTLELAATPYTKTRNKSGSICADVTVRSGENVGDTWVKFLKRIDRVSEGAAETIARFYPTIGKLYEAYLADPAAAPSLLENLQIFRDRVARRLGPALSRKVYSILMNDNPLYEPYGDNR